MKNLNQITVIFRRVFWVNKLITWKTFLLLGILFWLLAGYATDENIKNILSGVGLISALICLTLFVQENIIRIRPVVMKGSNNSYFNNWIISLIICFLIFGIFPGQITHWAWVLCPPVAAIATALPEFWDTPLKLKLPTPEVRLRLSILLLSHLLISCWIQFYFTIDQWIKTNPQLLDQDFSKSLFVFKING